jgi:PAS domain S-box-containing protein
MEHFELLSAYEHNPMGILFTDSQGIITFINPSGCRLLGFKSEKLIGSSIHKPVWGFFHEDGSDFKPGEHPVCRLLKGETEGMKVIISAFNEVQDRFFWVMVSAFFVGSKDNVSLEKPAIVCFMEDISALKIAADSLVQSNERFERIFNEGPLPMALLGSDFRFMRTNEPFREMVGYSEEELSAMTFMEITHDEHLAADMEAVKKVLYGIIPNYRTEKRYVRKDKGVVWGALTVLAIHDQTGHFVHFLGLVKPLPGHS